MNKKLLNITLLSNTRSSRRTQIRVLSSSLRRQVDLGINNRFKMLAVLGVSQHADINLVQNMLSLLYPNFLLKLSVLLKRKVHEQDWLLWRWKYFNQLNFYKGVRFHSSLPVRGQRTHTNAQTSKKKNHI